MLQAELGLYTNEQLSMYTNAMLESFLLVLVTDRTSMDVSRWKTLRDKGWVGMTESERKEWLGEIQTTPTATKGMYTHNDLNRIETAIELLSLRMYTLGYIDSLLEVKKDWSYQDDIWRDDMVRILGNVSTLRNSVVVYPTTPMTPNINRKLDYVMANEIEQILIDIDDIISKRIQSRHHVGEIYSGEV